ncbi:hypothetical protein AB0I06_13580, partial [Streptomyces sp. NPDC050674]|uniref:hypothetical protein n=1 Tax=Streptomyces sp. NPDC050674 TaxID=3157216 RepID=UPI00344A20F5
LTCAAARSRGRFWLADKCRSPDRHDFSFSGPYEFEMHVEMHVEIYEVDSYEVPATGFPLRTGIVRHGVRIHRR